MEYIDENKVDGERWVSSVLACLQVRSRNQNGTEICANMCGLFCRRLVQERRVTSGACLGDASPARWQLRVSSLCGVETALPSVFGGVQSAANVNGCANWRAESSAPSQYRSCRLLLSHGCQSIQLLELKCTKSSKLLITYVSDKYKSIS